MTRQMMLLIMLFAAAVIVSVFVLEESFLQKEPRTASPAPVTPQTLETAYELPFQHLIAIDMNADGIVNTNSILDGTDSFLLIARNGSLASGSAVNSDAADNVFFFHDLSSLANYDLNLSNSIEENDPVYNHLLIGTYNKDKNEASYKLLSQMNILQLLLNKEHLDLDRENNLKRLDIQAGNAVTDAGRQLKIKVVPLGNSFMSQIRLQPSPEIIVYSKSLQ